MGDPHVGTGAPGDASSDIHYPTSPKDVSDGTSLGSQTDRDARSQQILLSAIQGNKITDSQAGTLASSAASIATIAAGGSPSDAAVVGYVVGLTVTATLDYLSGLFSGSDDEQKKKKIAESNMCQPPPSGPTDPKWEHSPGGAISYADMKPYPLGSFEYVAQMVVARNYELQLNCRTGADPRALIKGLAIMWNRLHLEPALPFCADTAAWGAGTPQRDHDVLQIAMNGWGTATSGDAFCVMVNRGQPRSIVGGNVSLAVPREAATPVVAKVAVGAAAVGVLAWIASVVVAHVKRQTVVYVWRHAWDQTKRAFARENPVRCPTNSRVQSLVFARARWTPKKAARWAEDHGYHASKIDVTPNTIRLRQAAPGQFARLRTVPFGHGIQAVVGWSRC